MSNDISYQGTYIDERVKERILNKSSIYENYDLSSNSLINIPIPKIDDSSSQTFFHIEFDEFPEYDNSEFLRNGPKISFDKDIKEEMLENIAFRKFISEIENRLFSFKENNKLSFSANLHFQHDWEIENLRNIILLIKFSDIPFEIELQVWKKLSFFVRQGLQLSEDFLGSKEFIKEFTEYRKEFYIKLDLT